MAVVILRWLGKNLGSLLLAFILALIVWISAVTAADPNVEQNLARPVEIKIIGKAPELKLMQSSQNSVRLKLKAPQSIWDQVNNDSGLVRAWIDLSGLGPGEHRVPVLIEIDLAPVRLVTQEPLEVTVELEQIVNEIHPVVLSISGTPPVGYRMDEPTTEPNEVVISGPASLVAQVDKIQASLDIAGATDTITQTVSLFALDANDQVISGITISPAMATIRQPISLLGGYRNVIVKVVTQGNVGSGYRLTNYYASPSSVVVFSGDPALVEALPGYVETLPLDLNNATDDFEALLELNLPEGITAVSDPRGLVQVSIAAIESSLTISLPIDITGLAPGWEAEIAPATVDVILSGPVPLLNDLRPENIRVKVDLSGYDIGVHQVIPVIDFLPDQIQKISILPATIEVTIVPAPTPTPTPRVTAIPGGQTPTPTPTPTPTSGTPTP